MTGTSILNSKSDDERPLLNIYDSLVWNQLGINCFSPPSYFKHFGIFFFLKCEMYQKNPRKWNHDKYPLFLVSSFPFNLHTEVENYGNEA